MHNLKQFLFRATLSHACKYLYRVIIVRKTHCNYRQCTFEIVHKAERSNLLICIQNYNWLIHYS